MKYSFGDIYGNGQIKQALEKSVFGNKLSHAYIFEGAEGSGKSMLALSFAKLIFCKTKRDGCGCHSCVQFEAESHSDFFFIKRGDTKSIGVERIRNSVVNEAVKKPFEYERKVFIIDSADYMTTEAQNALLRSIEEPPPYAVFILLAENTKNLLQTVISRCFIYKIRPFEISAVSEFLVRRGVPRDKAVAVCAYSGGSIGKALSLLESEVFFEMRERVNSFLAGSGGDLERLFSGVGAIADYKDYSDLFIVIALVWYRDVLAYKSTCDFETLYQQDCRAKIKQCGETFSYKKLYCGHKSLMELKKSVSANTPYGAALEAFIINLSSSGENI